MSDQHDDKTRAPGATPPTLTETDLVSAPAITRRTALLAIGGVTLGATSAVSATLSGCIVRTQPAYQQPVYVQQAQPQAVYVQPSGYQRAYSGATDGDAGQYADPAGYGRGTYRGAQTGLTDSDNGSGGIQDPAGQGRGHHGQPGWQSGVTDSDGGSYADPAGNGRGRGPQGNSGLTDSDSGSYADPAGRGRGRWR